MQISTKATNEYSKSNKIGIKYTYKVARDQKEKAALVL